jgi:hypothetical protein
METANSGTECLFSLRQIGGPDYYFAPVSKQSMKKGVSLNV